MPSINIVFWSLSLIVATGLIITASSRRQRRLIDVLRQKVDQSATRKTTEPDPSSEPPSETAAENEKSAS